MQSVSENSLRGNVGTKFDVWVCVIMLHYHKFDVLIGNKNNKIHKSLLFIIQNMQGRKKVVALRLSHEQLMYCVFNVY